MVSVPVRRRSLLLALALPLLFTPSVDAQPFGAIAGRVRHAVTGRPIAGIEVRARTLGGGSQSPPAGRATTGPDGRYRIDGLRTDPGLERYIASIEHGTAGYLGQLYDGVPCWGSIVADDFHGILLYSCGGIRVEPTIIEIRAGRTVRGVDFELAGRVGSIAGSVTAAATGEPVAGVEIELWPGLGSRAEAVTDAGGRYRFGDLPPDDYRLVAEPISGFVSEVHPGTHCPYNDCSWVPGEPVVLASGQDRDGVDFALEGPGGVAGRVTDAATGAALPGLEVSAYDPQGFRAVAATVGGDGGYRLAGLPPGDYTVFTGDGPGVYVDEIWNGAPCVGPLGERLHCSSGYGDPVAVAAAETTEGVDFDLDPGGTISGRMTGDGTPLAGVAVTLRIVDGESRATVLSDGEGRYRSQGFPGGRYRLFTAGAAAHGFVDEIYDGVACSAAGHCPVGVGDTVEVALGAETAAVDFTLEPFGAIAGTLTAATTGEPLAGAELGFWGGPSDYGGFARTDPAGRYVSPRLPRGAYYVATRVSGGPQPWTDEVYDDVLCPYGPGSTCAVDEGTPVIVRSGETTEGIDLAVEPAVGFTCTPTASGVCLHGGRFWASVAAADRMTAPLALGTAEASAFTLADPANPEVAVRVIDACDPFGAYWVFATGLTDRNAYVVVIDSWTGVSWRYFNDFQTPFPAVLDTAGLAVCDAASPAGTASAVPARPAIAAAGERPAAGPGAAPSFPCVASPHRICLRGGRFSVEAEWELPLGESGVARAEPLTDRAGWFWFHRPQAPELLVKVLDGCRSERPAYWVFAGGLTHAGVRLRVTDLAADQTREYFHPAGHPFEPIQDVTAFATCP